METEIIIQNALKEGTQIDHIKLASLSGFNTQEITMLKLFWEPVFNKSWIYLADYMIYEFLGYKKTDTSSRDFYRTLKKYKDIIDYKKVDKTNEIVIYYEKLYKERFPCKDNRGGHNKQYYIITGETFKKMGMRANTEKGNEICDYFIKVESLASTMTKYFVYKQLEDTQKQLEDSQKQLTDSNKELENTHKKLENVDKELEHSYKELENTHEKLKDAIKTTNYLEKANELGVTFLERTIKVPALYNGSNDKDFYSYFNKSGKTTRPVEKRASEHSSGNSEEFKMRNTYKTYEDCVDSVERLIHAILKPFQTHRTNGKVTEIFNCHNILIDNITKRILKSVDGCIPIINDYIRLLKSNSYDFEKITHEVEERFGYKDDVQQIINVTNNINSPGSNNIIIQSSSNVTLYPEERTKGYKQCLTCKFRKLKEENFKVNNYYSKRCHNCRSYRIGFRKCKTCKIQKLREENFNGSSTVCHNCRQFSNGFIKCKTCKIQKLKKDNFKVNNYYSVICHDCRQINFGFKKCEKII